MNKNKYSKKEILIMIKNIFLVILGTVILAFGTGVFLFPFDIITGGIAGIAITLNNLIPEFEFLAFKSYDIYVFIVTWGLFIVGLFVLGIKSFDNSFLRDFWFSPWISSPSHTIEIFPVSSETTTATASLTSVIPIAALCLVPIFSSMLSLVDNGKKHPAEYNL